MYSDTPVSATWIDGISIIIYHGVTSPPDPSLRMTTYDCFWLSSLLRCSRAKCII